MGAIQRTLKAYFSQEPPHTIQRLAELVINPSKHYRTLSSYLHALDRVVHVTSPASTYPLPAAVPDAAGLKILSNGIPTGPDPSLITWGASTIKDPSFGSDESLGGALLTPISWVVNPVALVPSNFSVSGTNMNDINGEVKTESTETIDGPNGIGSIETVSVSVNGVSSTRASPSIATDLSSQLRAEGGVTQGEILRQEQKAGVVPAAHLAAELTSRLEEDDEIPHARGPEEVGMSDLGPQKPTRTNLLHSTGVDVEAAVGRTAIDNAPNLEVIDESRTDPGLDTGVEMLVSTKREAEDDIQNDSKRLKEDNETFKASSETRGVKKHSDEKDGQLTKEEAELVDADGRTIDELKFGDKGETAGADAVDTTTL